MNNVWRLFRFDLGRLKANVMSIIITLGLVLVPSLFAWYNIIACWNVFDNTGNLTVAVANTDEGYQSDLIPLRINIGDQVVSALRANDQIDWQFTDENDAIDGAKSGRYYAAVVIPKSFSRDMLTFYTGDAGHADIVYYANEKKSAIAPKITDQGADSVSYQVNAVFAQTLSEVSLSLAESLSSFADEDDWDGRIAVVADHVREMADAFDDASGVLSLYGSLARSCEDLSRHSADLATQASTALDETLSAATGRADAVPATVDALKGSADTLKSSLADSAAAFGAVSDSVDALFDAASGDSKDIAGDLRAQADALASHATVYRQVADSLEGAAPSLPESLRPQVTALAGRARAVASQADSMAASLRTAADKLEAGDTDLSAERDAAKAKAAEAAASVNSIKDDYEAHVAPGLASLAEQAASMADALSGVSDDLKGVGGELSSSATSAADVMAGTADKIAETTEKLKGVSSGLREMASDIDGAIASGDRDALRAVLGSDVSALSKALASPVGVERIAVFPVENFGSAMAPLYTTLALFIGSLLILVVFKPKATRTHPEGGGACEPEAAAAVLRPLRRHGRGVAGPIDGHGAGQSVLPRRAGDLAMAVHGVLLGRGPCVHVHHLRAGGVLRQPRQGHRGASAHRAGDRLRRLVPAADHARFRAGPLSLASRHPRGERHAKRHDGHLRRRLLGSDGRTRPVPHPGGALGPGAPQAPREVHGMVRGKGGELEAHQLARAARPKRPPFLILPFFGSECHFDPEMASQMPVEGRNGRKNSGMSPKNRPFRG